MLDREIFVLIALSRKPMLKRACENTQSGESISCSYTQGMDVAEGSVKILNLKSHKIAAYVCLKNAFSRCGKNLNL